MTSRRIKLFSMVVVAFFLATACGGGNSPQTSTSPPVVNVKLQELKSSNVEDSSEFVGTLEAKEKVILRPQIEGRILQVLAKNGDRVKSGAAIIQLRPDRQRAQVNPAKASVSAQKTARSNAEVSLKQAEAQLEGAEAARKQALANVSSRQADLENRVANLKLQEQNYQRTASLVAEGAQSQQRLEVETNNRDSAIAAKNSAQEQLNAAKASLSAEEGNLKAAKERVAAARTLLEKENANISQTEAQLATQREDLQSNRVIAPINGVVGDIKVKVGDYVKTGDQLTTITQDKSFDLPIAIPVERSDELKVGLPVQIIAKDKNKILATGRISFISPKVDTSAQAILAKATFSNNVSLRDGQFVRAKVTWNQRSGILLPTIAVSRIGGENFVFIAEKDKSGKQQIVRQKSVKLGNMQGQNYQVIDGVKAGDKIAVSSILKLRDGAAIQPES